MSKTGDKVFGKFNRTENLQLAEIFIRDQGYGTEFNLAGFVASTGILYSTASKMLPRLIEAGIIAAYPHPKIKSQTLYRVAWPVLIVKPATVPQQVTAETVERFPKEEDYTVTLHHPSEKSDAQWEIHVKAESPQHAASKAREMTKVTVTKSWEL